MSITHSLIKPRITALGFGLIALLVLGSLNGCSFSGIQRGTSSSAGYLPLLDSERVNRDARLIISLLSHIEIASNLPDVVEGETDIRAHAVRGLTQVFTYVSLQHKQTSLPDALMRAAENKAEMLLYFTPKFLDKKTPSTGVDIRLFGGLGAVHPVQHYEIRLFDVISGHTVDSGAIIISRAFWKEVLDPEQIDVAFRQYAALVSGRS